MRHLLCCAAMVGGLAVLPWLNACSDGGETANSPAAPQAAATVPKPSATPTTLARADFDVQGMDCGGCVIGTRAVLGRLEGVREADATYDAATGKGTAWARYDPAKVTPERMIAAIKELGYTATAIKG